MKVKFTCIAKQRDGSGAIQSYVLQDQYGEQLVVSRNVILEIMQNPNYSILNLKLSANGKIIDKKITQGAKRDLTPQDYAAALFRSKYETQGKTIEQIKTAMHNALHTELATRQISMNTLGSLSDSLERVYAIHGRETIRGICPVTGYVLKNIGNVPIHYKRIDTESGQESMSVIQPNETKALTNIETVTLLMDAKFSFKIHNAEMCLGAKDSIGLSRYKDMLNCGLYKTTRGNLDQIFYTDLPESEQARFWKSGQYEYRF